MARVFAYLMSNDLEEIDEALIFQDTAVIIGNALKKVHANNSSSKNLAKTAFEIALKQLAP
jgi:hypothetical protein